MATADLSLFQVEKVSIALPRDHVSFALVEKQDCLTSGSSNGITSIGVGSIHSSSGCHRNHGPVIHLGFFKNCIADMPRDPSSAGLELESM